MKFDEEMHVPVARALILLALHVLLAVGGVL